MTRAALTVAILLAAQYQDQEVWYPYYRLREAGARVVLIGPERKTYPSKHGYPATADLAIAEATSGEYDGVIIPGGFAPDFMRREPRMAQFVRDAHQQGKIIAAICHGPWLLCSADVLRGKTATCFFAIKDDVMNAGATYVDRAVVRDGNLITSRTPEDLPVFMVTFLQALTERAAPAPTRRPAPAASANARRPS